MQVQEARGAPLSFPFSTWCGPEMDEALGAATDAWLDPAKWGRWETGLLARIDEARASIGPRRKLRGCFVLTAMCHVAASAAGFAEMPLNAAEAIRRLEGALAQFRSQSGDPYTSFVAGEHRLHPTVLAWYSSQPAHHLARVGAQHICRLKLVLERLFDPQASLFAPPATDSSGARLDCEWTVKLFAREAEALRVSAPSGGGGRGIDHLSLPGFLSCLRRRPGRRPVYSKPAESPVSV